MSQGLSHWYWNVTLTFEIEDMRLKDVYGSPTCFEMAKTERCGPRYDILSDSGVFWGSPEEEG